jgi:UDP:flavonoid glycosyltransferase YjiC (YdhE family)
MMRVLNDVFFGPLYADEVLAAVARELPDVLLVDQMRMMAWIAAESTSLPTAILWHTVFNGTAGMVNMVNMFVPQMNALRARVGLPPIEPPWTMARSGVPILAFTYREFDDPSPTTPAEVQYVGPLACLPRSHSSYTLPWPADDRRPLILVSYSTSYQDQVGTLQRVADAVADVDARVLMTFGHSIAPDELRLPANVAAERFIPHASVLPHTDLVVNCEGRRAQGRRGIARPAPALIRNAPPARLSTPANSGRCTTRTGAVARGRQPSWLPPANAS